MVLLDWTRMGKVYCLAGVVFQGGQYRVVRPMQVRNRSAEQHSGWSPFRFDGRRRWEVFKLVAPEPAAARAPHLEDVWVRDLRPTGRLAPPDERRAILRATLPVPGEHAFGAALTATRTAVYLRPGGGARSLASLLTAADQVRFSWAQREGHPETDFRVSLSVPGLDARILPLKDHFLLLRAEESARHGDGRVQALQRMVRDMGERIVVRLGLSRPFAADPQQGEARCWLMADGFFSLADPQP
jgi:hypothetical protein